MFMHTRFTFLAIAAGILAESATAQVGKSGKGSFLFSKGGKSKSSKTFGKSGKSSKHECKVKEVDTQNLPSKIEFSSDAWLPEEGNAAQRLGIPSLTQPYYNTVVDVRTTMSAADVKLIFSTNGNWQAALLKLLDTKYFPANEAVKDSYLITTSPPIAIAQMDSGMVKVGNILYKNAQPHVVAGPKKYLDKFEAEGHGSGDRIAIIKTYGNVILKRKGDESIQSFADLACIEPGRFASSNPAESGSYGNYKESVRNIASSNPELLEGTATTADELVERLFEDAGVASIGPPMHRSLPHMIATGQADAGLIFLHLAVLAMKENPGMFEIIYLATDKTGSTDDPDVLIEGQTPLEGNKAGTFFVLKTSKTGLSDEQVTARDNFILDLQSQEFTGILAEVGLSRPDGFTPVRMI